MFNSSERRKAIEELNNSVEEHEMVRKQVERVSVHLFHQRQRTVSEVVKPVEEYANLLANSPEALDKSVAEFRVEANRFSGTVRQFETEAALSTKIGSATGAAWSDGGCGSRRARTVRGHGDVNRRRWHGWWKRADGAGWACGLGELEARRSSALACISTAATRDTPGWRPSSASRSKRKSGR